MSKHRIDPPDTIDQAIRHLAGLQADGWQLDAITTDIDYQAPSDKHRAIPVETTITIRLHPIRV